MTATRIDLDWTRLLGFNHCRTGGEASEPIHASKVGSKDPVATGQRGDLSLGLSAKVGAKQMLRRAGEPDSVALVRLTKVGLKTK